MRITFKWEEKSKNIMYREKFEGAEKFINFLEDFFGINYKYLKLDYENFYGETMRIVDNEDAEEFFAKILHSKLYNQCLNDRPSFPTIYLKNSQKFSFLSTSMRTIDEKPMIEEKKDNFSEILEKFEEIKNAIFDVRSLFPSSNNNLNNLKHEDKDVVRLNTTCKICKTSPIVGKRYLCIDCDNFSICEKCETNGHNHTMIRIINNNDFYISDKMVQWKKQNFVNLSLPQLETPKKDAF